MRKMSTPFFVFGLYLLREHKKGNATQTLPFVFYTKLVLFRTALLMAPKPTAKSKPPLAPRLPFLFYFFFAAS